MFKLLAVAGLALAAAGAALGPNPTLIGVGAMWTISFGGIALLKHSAKEAASRRTQIRLTGIPADVTVRAAQHTGVVVNERPQMALRLLVQPHDGTPAFEVERTMVVPFEGLAALSGTYSVRGHVSREDGELVVNWGPQAAALPPAE